MKDTTENMTDTIEVYGKLEVIIGQHIYEQRYADQGGLWSAVNLDHRPIWYKMARSILGIVNDYHDAITWSETGRAEH
jgi:hypothetical protein